LSAAALVAVSASGGGARQQEALAAAAAALRGQQVDEIPHDFELRTLDGGSVRLSSLEGEVVFLNFWATWCPPCREELPDMAALAKRMAGRGFRMVAVSQDESWAELEAFFGPAGSPPGLTIALDPGGRLAHMYGTEKLPETYVIGRKGAVLARWVNAQPWSAPEMISWFERALASGR
jgi:thiol-disulfide isomerase/thioredoxin